MSQPGQQFLGSLIPPPLVAPKNPPLAPIQEGGLLGNRAIQSPELRHRLDYPQKESKRPNVQLLTWPVNAQHPVSAQLEALKKRKFTSEGRRERIRKALAALAQEPTIQLSSEIWRRIAEDPDLEDQI